jgi:hypothetical protein
VKAWERFLGKVNSLQQLAKECREPVITMIGYGCYTAWLLFLLAHLFRYPLITIGLLVLSAMLWLGIRAVARLFR